MTQASTKPPTFVIFVNSKELMHYSYQRYIENQIRKNFGLEYVADLPEPEPPTIRTLTFPVLLIGK